MQKFLWDLGIHVTRSQKGSVAPLDYHHQIIDELQAIFVHVPKTAGRSIETRLAQYTSKRPISGHTASFEYQLICPSKWKSYFKFGFVRNPWDRLLSAFHYLSVEHQDILFVKQHISSHKGNFNSFVEQTIHKHPSCIYWVDHLKPQAYFLCHHDGSIAVDYVGRYENLMNDWMVICNKIGIETYLPHLNKSRRQHQCYREYYTKKSAKIVADVYQRDIELFGYCFGD